MLDCVTATSSARTRVHVFVCVCVLICIHANKSVQLQKGNRGAYPVEVRLDQSVNPRVSLVTTHVTGRHDAEDGVALSSCSSHVLKKWSPCIALKHENYVSLL